MSVFSPLVIITQHVKTATETSPVSAQMVSTRVLIKGQTLSLKYIHLKCPRKMTTPDSTPTLAKVLMYWILKYSLQAWQKCTHLVQSWDINTIRGNVQHNSKRN